MTVSNNINPSQHTFPSPAHHNDNPEPKVDPTHDTATNSPTFHKAATTNTFNIINSKPKAPSPIPEICSAIILPTVSTLTTNTAIEPNPFSNNTAPQDSATNHELRNPADNPRIQDPSATSTTLPHNNYKPAPSQPTFAHWCQEHTMLTSKIHCSTKHMMAAALFRPTSRHKIPSKHNHESTTITHAKFAKHLSHESTIISRTPSNNTTGSSSINHPVNILVLATHVKHLLATTQSQETSTLRRHHKQTNPYLVCTQYAKDLFHPP